MKQVFYILICTLLLAACGGSDSPEVDVKKDYINVTPTVDLLGAGDTKDLSVTANCAWTVANNATDWLTVNPMSGNGNGQITLSAGKNTTGKVRTAVIMIDGGGVKRSVTVSQNLPDEELTVSPMELSFVVDGGAHTLNIVSNGNWSIEAPGWCPVSKSSGFGNSEVTVTAKKNTTAEKREGKLIVKGEVAEREVLLQQEVADLPTITSCNVGKLTATTAEILFKFSSVLPVTSYGACFSATNHEPTMADTHVDKTNSSESADVSVALSGLKRNTYYFVRAYATSAVGTQYGPVIEFSTLDNVPGSDDNVPPQ